MRYNSQMKPPNSYLELNETRETAALLKILSLGNKQIAQGKIKPVAYVVNRLRARATNA